jgi:hypothetical protein
MEEVQTVDNSRIHEALFQAATGTNVTSSQEFRVSWAVMLHDIIVEPAALCQLGQTGLSVVLREEARRRCLVGIVEPADWLQSNDVLARMKKDRNAGKGTGDAFLVMNVS